MSKGASRKQQRQEARVKATRMKQLRYGGAAIIIILTIAALALWRNAGVVPAEELASLVEPNLDGPIDAPVKVVEYGDLACSSCKQWHNLGIKEQLQAEFGDQVSFEFRHFPVITATSPKGAEAAQCAAEQGAFWGFHDYIYENLEDYPNLGTERVKEIASAVGLNREAFDSCVDSGKYRDFVTQATRQAQAAGARGTPTFFLNGQQISPTYQSMSATISEILNN